MVWVITYHISDAFLNDGSYSVKILRRKPEGKNEKSSELAVRGAEIVHVHSTMDYSMNILAGLDLMLRTKTATFYWKVHC